MSVVVSLLMIIADTYFWMWTLIDHVVGFVLGLAGFQQDEDEGTKLPTWAAWTALTALLGAVSVLLYAVMR